MINWNTKKIQIFFDLCQNINGGSKGIWRVMIVMMVVASLLRV